MIDEKTESAVPMEQTPVTPDNSKKDPKRDQPEVVLAGVGILGAVVAGSAYHKSQGDTPAGKEPDIASMTAANPPEASNPPIEEKPVAFDAPEKPLPTDNPATTTAKTDPAIEPEDELEMEIGKPFQMNDELTGIPLDLNQNQTIDGVIVLNASGQTQALALDQNENEVIEMMLVDTNEDGKADTILLDLNEDGTWDEARPLSTADAPAVALEIPLDDIQNQEVVVVDTHVVIPDCPPEASVVVFDSREQTQQGATSETVAGQHVTMGETAWDGEIELETVSQRVVETDTTVHEHTYEREIEDTHFSEVVSDSTTQQHIYDLEIEVDGETLHQRVTETVFIQETHQIEIETIAELDLQTDDESAYDNSMDYLELGS